MPVFVVGAVAAPVELVLDAPMRPVLRHQATASLRLLAESASPSWISWDWEQVADIRERLVADYWIGLQESGAAAHRRLSLAIVEIALASGCLTEVPARVLRETRRVLTQGPLSDDVGDRLSDELHDFLVAKNGQAFYLRDREDKIIRAAFEVFYSSVGDDSLESVTANVAALLDGSAADVR